MHGQQYIKHCKLMLNIFMHSVILI